MALTYDDMLEQVPVAAFARNNDLIAEMPNAIRRAETYVVDRLDHDAFRMPPQDVTFGTDGAATLPDNVLELRAVRIRFRSSGWTPLLPRHEETLHALFAGQPPGNPRFYAQPAHGTVQIFARPSTATAGQLVYNAKPAELGPTVQTNLLTDDWEAVMRAAVLREAALFMNDQKLIPIYQAELADLLTAANMAVARRRRDETAERPRETANVRGA
jgi:hypothetical protein